MKVYCLSHTEFKFSEWNGVSGLELHTLVYSAAHSDLNNILNKLREAKATVLLFDFSHQSALTDWYTFKARLNPLLPCVGWFAVEDEARALEMLERGQIQDYLLNNIEGPLALRKSVFLAKQHFHTETGGFIKYENATAPTETVVEHSPLEYMQIQDIIDMLPQPIFIKNRKHQWVLINQQFCDLIGHTREELLGKSDFDFFPETESKVFWEKDELVFTTGEPNINEEEATTFHEQTTHTILTKKVLYIAPNQERYLIGSVTNIDKLKAAQNEIENLINDIEERVQERTLELQREVEQRRDVETKLTASLQEKEVLLQEVYHRVKNNLQVISSMLNLQARRSDDSASLDLLRSTQSRVQAMALVHEKLYESDNLSQINFAEYTKSLSRNLSYTYGQKEGNIRIVYEVSPVLLSIGLAVPCGLILNEIISHVFQAAQQELPDQQDEVLLFEISLFADVDFNCHFTLKLKSPDFDDLNWFSPEGLGLRLIKSLAEQIRGEIEIFAQHPAHIHLHFPIRQTRMRPA